MGGARVSADLVGELYRVDGVTEVLIELADDVGALKSIVAVAIVVEQAHAPVVEHASKLDVESPAKPNVAVGFFYGEAVRK